MAYKACEYCGNKFWSKHSVAQFCSRKCAGTVNLSRYVHSQIYSNEHLLDIIRSAALKLGRTPTKREITKPSERTYRERFGSYNNAVIAAGLVPNIQLPPSFLEMERNGVKLSIRYKILKRDAFTCQYCGGTPAKGYLLHVDHIIPVSEGGPTVESNLITACWLCNIGKSNST